MTTNRTKSVAAIAAIIVGASLTACSQTAETTPTAVTTSVSATTSAAAEPAPTDSSDKTAAAVAESKLTVTDVRIGSHENFDRVVYEMGGTGTPGWRVKYVDAAVQEGSGKPMDVAGGAIIQVLIDGSGYPFDSGVEQYSGPNPVPGIAGGVVTEVNGSSVFEGVTQSFIGVTEKQPFSVTLLSDPTRVVVDVAK
ncbi:hypothetical protein ACFRFQ_24210 [Rhodococcus sp. NPDC056743]|jgi:hypothetical protein|uniref:AMIN-like domain-containing (lipo)protein n=1 Tax=unclassified Rhodococcus (in: high G+C Gram-positive bacteria) TaxID=192944 RepID=UPI00110F1DE6|nr:hypothetical protein [Rhodococcus sp. KBS0724]TSD46235.1 hypothetical protein FFI94_008700 [Rhodococcus sp. KBS0724]